MSKPAPPITRSRIEALLPLLHSWLIAIASALLVVVERSTRHPRWQRQLVFWLERGLARWLFLTAFLRVGPPPRSRATKRPKGAPSGFRVTRAQGNVVRRLARIRGAHAPITTRLRRLLDIAAKPERTLKRLTARLARVIARGGLVGFRLVAVTPPALMLATNAPASACAAADSS